MLDIAIGRKGSRISLWIDGEEVLELGQAEWQRMVHLMQDVSIEAAAHMDRQDRSFILATMMRAGTPLDMAKRVPDGTGTRRPAIVYEGGEVSPPEQPDI